MSAQHTPVTIGRKHYVVVHDEKGVIRVHYTHAVLGLRNLNLNGPTARAAIAKATGSAA